MHILNTLSVIWAGSNCNNLKFHQRFSLINFIVIMFLQMLSFSLILLCRLNKFIIFRVSSYLKTKESNCHNCNDILPSEHRLVQRIVISRDTLLSHRKFGWKPPMEAMITCKALGILKYRGKRGGQCRRQHACCLNRQEQNISVVTGNGEGTYKMRVKPLAGERCLVYIPRSSVLNALRRSEFAVPKFMFINICSLTKTKNRVRAPIALEVTYQT